MRTQLRSANWPETRLRYVSTLNPSRGEISELARDTAASFVPMDAIGDNGTMRLDTTRPLSEVEQGYTYFRDGDVLIAKITPCFENGKGAIAAGLHNGIGFGTTELIVVRPKGERTEARFLYWLFSSSSFRHPATAAMFGAGGQKRVPDEFVKDFRLALPPLEEQQDIASFLDRETGKIDELIAEQERLIGLLEEKRQAVISHVITKGLDTDAPLIASAVDWMGEVPAHWERIQLKRVLCSIDYGISEALDATDGVAVLRMSNIKQGQIVLEDLKFVDQVPDNLLVRQQDLFYNRTNSPDLVCQVGLLREAPAQRTSFASYLVRFRTTARASPEYLGYLLNHPSLLRYVRSLAFVAIGQANLNPTRYRNVVLRLPSLDEQCLIVAYLDGVLASLDDLSTQAGKAIDLLKERRAALISAAITGKIDVGTAVGVEALMPEAAE